MKNSLDTAMGLRLLGTFVGFFSAGIGVGGGAIMVPTLISLFRFEFRRAASTSLATIIPISLVGAASHMLLFKYHLHLSYFFIFIPACVSGAVLGGFFLKSFQTHYLKVAFAIFIMIAGLRMLKVYDFSFLLFDSLKEPFAGEYFIPIIIFGIITGFIATLLGVGCGLIIVPFFVFFIGLGMHEAITLSLTTMFFLTLTATLVHGKYRALDKASVRKILPPALVGAIIGAAISSHLPELVLKKIFGAFLLIMALRFFIEEGIFAFLKARRRIQDEYQQV